MSIIDEIIDAEERMHVVLTKRQRATVEAWLEGRLPWTDEPFTTYPQRVLTSVLEARK